MKKVAVIGGGLAGLAAAVELIDAGLDVTIFESASDLGGRAKSFYHNPQNELVDNGQHILMGCYSHTLDFIEKIGADDKFYFQENLEINFVRPGGELMVLKAGPGLYPFNLAKAFFNYPALGIKDKLSVLKLISKLFFTKPEKFSEINVINWLKNNSQSYNAIKSFWEPLAIGALNTGLNKASAEVFISILKIIFLSGNKSATIILPGKLSESFSEPARNYILNNGGKIKLSERVLNINAGEDNSNSPEIRTNKSFYNDFDFSVIAVAPHSLLKIFQVENILSLNEIEYSPIISISFWLQNNPFSFSFAGLLESKVHWLFNKESYISLVISAAEELENLNKEELFEICVTELEKYFPYFRREDIICKSAVKERRATFIANNSAQKVRKNLYIDYGKIVLAGDWVNTGLPGTIEGAVQSGIYAARLIKNKLENK